MQTPGETALILFVLTTTQMSASTDVKEIGRPLVEEAERVWSG
jgi:hypothetical protein